VLFFSDSQRPLFPSVYLVLRAAVGVALQGFVVLHNAPFIYAIS